MSVSDTTDAVATVKDILEDTTDSDWTAAGTKPSVIEYQSETDQNGKHQRAQRGTDALYLWSPAEGTVESYAAQYNSYLDSQVVNVDPWTSKSRSHAANLSGDIRDIINDYALDNKSSTEWNRIRPETENDLRHEASAERSPVYRIITLVRLVARREV